METPWNLYEKQRHTYRTIPRALALRMHKFHLTGVRLVGETISMNLRALENTTIVALFSFLSNCHLLITLVHPTGKARKTVENVMKSTWRANKTVGLAMKTTGKTIKTTGNLNEIHRWYISNHRRSMHTFAASEDQKACFFLWLSIFRPLIALLT